MSPDEHRQLGTSIAECMADYARAEKATDTIFAVDQISTSFTLKPEHGDLAGFWRIIIRRDQE